MKRVRLPIFLATFLCGLLSSVTCRACGTDFYGRTGYPGSSAGADATFTWNAAGGLFSDSSRGISSISYNWNGQPLCVSFSNGSYIDYAYDVEGALVSSSVKGKASTLYPGGSAVTLTNERQYCGPFVLDNGSLSMARFDGGYFDSECKPHYQHADWQGSVSMVTDHIGKIVQHTGYYPYGEPWREPSGQPYLFSGKERLRQLTLTEYDFSARRYNSALALWTTPDPFAPDYAGIDPRVYCTANPVRFTDPDGQRLWSFDERGHISLISETDYEDVERFMFVESKSKQMADDNEQTENPIYIDIEKGSVEALNHYPSESDDYDVIKVRGDESATKLYHFLSDVVGKKTKTEVSHIKTGVFGEKGLNFISTSHETSQDASMIWLYNNQLRYKYHIPFIMHSHPGGNEASEADKIIKDELIRHRKVANQNIPLFKIYKVTDGTEFTF